MTTILFVAIIFTIFASSKFAWAHEEIHPHVQPQPHPHPQPQPHPQSQGFEGPVYEYAGQRLKIEPGHELCYQKCYQGIFAGEGSPLYAEKECYDMCHNNGKFVFPNFSPPPCANKV